MNGFAVEQGSDNTSRDCSSNASMHTNGVSSNESAESTACSCDGPTQCKACRMAQGRFYGKRHRLTIKKKTSLLSQERTKERTRSHELLESRPKDCIKCGAAITLSVDVALGKLVLEKNATIVSACETRLQECEEHLSNISEKWTSDRDADRRTMRQRRTCSTCENESCAKCQTRQKTRAYARKSRAHKDDNLRKCHELLRWAVDELNEQRGQIYFLRSQLKELRAQLYRRYSTDDMNLAVRKDSANSAEIVEQGPPPATEEPDSDYETISLGSQASWLRGPHRYSRRKKATTANNVCGGSFSRSSSRLSISDEQGKQEAMQFVGEEDPQTHKVDESGDRDTRLNSDSLEFGNHFYIDQDLLHISRSAIGFGAFATIYKGTLLPLNESRPHAVTDQSARVVAVKMRHRRYNANWIRFDHVLVPGFDDYDPLREMQILHKVGPNKHLVELVGYSYKNDVPVLVLEYCERGDLSTYLRMHLPDCKTAVDNINEPLQRHPGVDTQLSMLDLISFCRQISTGMTYLSSRGFVHRLLTAGSILLTSDMTVKIGTFTQCIRLNAEVYTETAKGYSGLAECCAPEVFSSLQFSVQSDVWCFGVVLNEIFTAGKTPYSEVGLHDPNDIMRWLAEGHRLEKPELCPPDIYELMLDCWRQHRRERPDFEKIELYFACCMEKMRTPTAASKTLLHQACVKGGSVQSRQQDAFLQGHALDQEPACN